MRARRLRAECQSMLASVALYIALAVEKARAPRLLAGPFWFFPHEAARYVRYLFIASSGVRHRARHSAGMNDLANDQVVKL